MVVPTCSPTLRISTLLVAARESRPKIQAVIERYVRISWRVVRNAPFPAQSGTAAHEKVPLHVMGLYLDNDMQINATCFGAVHSPLNIDKTHIFTATRPSTSALEGCVNYFGRQLRMSATQHSRAWEIMRGPRWPAIVPRRHARSAQVPLCSMKPCRPKESTG